LSLQQAGEPGWVEGRGKRNTGVVKEKDLCYVAELLIAHLKFHSAAPEKLLFDFSRIF